ncbi:hypothetical protein BG006_008634 [Podila minutissima]|uniref:Uncharacterized protein n=1 Tax=Podila minutissima TaxID=64525 RepID=A0A9P5SIF9_9FUNG|nr:hypothetical protein BG006_008634 [Podila minutissima]
MERHLAALEESSRRLMDIDVNAPRLYISLLLENEAVPVRDATAAERNLHSSNCDETLRNIKLNENTSDFEKVMEMALTLNEICANDHIQELLHHTDACHEDVMNSLAKLNASIAEVEEANRTGDLRRAQNDAQEQDELLPDIEREEGEIFALEQILSEKRQLLSQMQKELDALADMAASNEDMYQDPDPEADANNTAQIMEIEYLEEKLNQLTRQEQEQHSVFDQLAREREELAAQLQGDAHESEENSSPAFEDILKLWERISNQEGDAVIEPRGCREAVLKLETLLDGYERAQNDIIQLDTRDIDPPLSTTVKLAARTLQLLTEAGGSMALQELKERVGLEAEARGETDSLGVQAVYGLVACHLIHIDRSTKTNLVTFT